MAAKSNWMSLNFAPMAYWMAVIGALVLAPPMAFAIHAYGRLLDGLDIIIRQPGSVVPTIFLLALVGTGSACLLLWMRQPKGAHISWDELGVTDWDGDGVRRAIRWKNLKRDFIQVVFVKKHSNIRYTGGQIHQLSDDEGRRITYSTADARLYWMFNRRMFTKRENLELTGHERKFPKGDVKPDAPRPETGIAIYFTRLGYIALLVAVPFLTGSYSSRAVDNARFVGLFFAIGGGLLLLRCLRPWFELRRIGKEERRFADAQVMEIVDNEGRAAILKGSQGHGDDVVDTTRLHHPDGLLETRRGKVRVVEDEQAGITAIEHVGTHAARRHLKRAVLAELFVRVVLALFFGLSGAYFLLEYL